MSTTHILRGFCALVLAGVGLLAGCQSEEKFSWNRLMDPHWQDPAELKLAEEHRIQFQEKGNPHSLKWLLGRLNAGMGLEDVNRILGQDGQRVYDDLRYKNKGGNYQSTDEGYKWGPANDGTIAVLFFRDGLLVNFNPRDYRES